MACAVAPERVGSEPQSGKGSQNKMKWGPETGKPQAQQGGED
jgi:hypothetical protein